MEYEIKQFGTVTVHIPILNEEQKKKRAESLGKLCMDIWNSWPEDTKKQFLKRFIDTTN